MQLIREQDSASIWTPSTPLPHMVQLDALRANAVVFHQTRLATGRILEFRPLHSKTF